MLSSTSSEEASNSNTTSSTTRSSSSQLVPNTSSSSKSLTSLINTKSSSPSSSSSSLIHQQPPPTTMEEVWKDINLSSLSEAPTLHQHQPIRTHHHHRPNTTTFRAGANIFQDFLARPFRNEPQIPPPPTTNIINHMANASSAITSNTTKTTTTFIGSLNASSSSSSPSSPMIPNHPITALSLNSGPEFRFLDSPVDPLIRPRNTNQISNLSSFTNSFESLGCAFGKKRFPSSGESNTTNSSGDRRHKRMIKNRESAARSRARKQAYTNELELEVAHLMEENARLRKQQEQLSQAAAAAQHPKKPGLQRTSTAPF